MKRPKGLVLVLAPLLSSAACAAGGSTPASPRPANSFEGVALSDLIANVKQHHGRRVRVVGFCHLEFEGDALYALSADYFQHLTKHAVWLDLDVETRHALLELSDGYVVVEATFDAERLGHLSLFSGTLTRVTRIERATAP